MYTDFQWNVLYGYPIWDSVWPYHSKTWISFIVWKYFGNTVLKKVGKYNFHSFVQFYSSGEGYIRVIVMFLGENRPEFDSLETARLLPSLSFFLSIVPRAGRKLRSKTLKLRTCTTQEHINTPGKFRLYYFSIWCIIYCYSNSHSNSYKIKDSPPNPHRLGCLWPGCSVLYVNQSEHFKCELIRTLGAESKTFGVRWLVWICSQ